jgi:hypothetical protein
VKATNEPIIPVPPLRVQTQNNSELWDHSDKEKAELFAARLLKVFTPNENHPDQEILQNILPIKLLSPNEIKVEVGFLNI